MYQLDREDGSEFGASIVPAGTSKMSLTAQHFVRIRFDSFL